MGTLNLMDSKYAEGYLESMFKFNSISPHSVLHPQDSGLVTSKSSSSQTGHVQGFVDSLSVNSFDPSNPTSNQVTSCCSETSELLSGVGDASEAPDFPDACLKYLSDILMEEDLDCKPATIHDYMALQATEKKFYDAIGKTYTQQSDQFPSPWGLFAQFPGCDFNTSNSGSGQRVNVHAASQRTVNSSGLLSQPESESSFIAGTPADHFQESLSSSSLTTAGADDSVVRQIESSLGGPLEPEMEKGTKLQWMEKAMAGFIRMGNPDFSGLIDQVYDEKIQEVPVSLEKNGNPAVNMLRSRKNRPRDDPNSLDTRNNKHIETFSEEDLMEQFDDFLLPCTDGTDDSSGSIQESSHDNNDANAGFRRGQKSGGYRGRTSRSKKQSAKDVVDLNALLNQCAQTVANFDLRNAHELLKRIRQHSSPRGDGIQRVAHYFADGLEARMAGTASQQYRSVVNMPISASQFMKAYQTFVKAVPFKRMSYFFANKTISKLSAEATSIHIIDFGILFGIQWPCFIQNLSQRENGPPKLRFTAVDFPQRGYQPAGRVKESVRRLTSYCQRFGVPFEYHAIAQNWETLQPEDFSIEKDELLVVNCLYRSRTLLDDTIEVDSPRDAFLKLIRNLNPDLFIHGILNGTHNAPFFTTRFREALFYYSSVYDFMEATITGDDEDRQLIERELCGKEILNVVASEGIERVERPETYKQWQVRNQRAGLRQMQLDRELVREAQAMVRAHYHKDFMVDEDNNWMLQGWKGRLLYALSCWKPT